MGDILVSGQKMQIPSMVFNFVVVINDSPYSLDIEPMHDNIVTPMIIIRSAAEKEIRTEDDKAIEKRLAEREGMEI